jgi:hypothetical protein
MRAMSDVACAAYVGSHLIAAGIRADDRSNEFFGQLFAQQKRPALQPAFFVDYLAKINTSPPPAR